jgi:DNA-directed RNA polymerase subunit E'/Rpb7
MLKTLVKNVVLQPNELGGNLAEVVAKKICDTYENTTTKDEGYIFQISKDIRILGNHISPSTGYEIIFKVKFSANVLKPEVGTVVEGRVIIVDERGIFISVEDKMNVLIPNSRLSDFEFDKKRNEFKSEEGRSIKTGDMVKATIVAIRYDKKFNCIGELN